MNSATKHRPFSYSAKEPGSSVISKHFIHKIRSSVALELLSLLSTFENSTKCDKLRLFLGPVHTAPFMYKYGEKNLRFCEVVTLV